MLVSVVVPVFDAIDTLPALFEALAAQSLDRFELIIADDNSSDGSRDWLEARRTALPLSILTSSTRRGSYGARNDALAIARGEILAFTDADCVPQRDWLERGLEALARAPRAAGHVRFTSPTTYSERLDAGRFLRQERYAREGFGATANLFVRREVFEAIGPFDARLISGGDWEHGRRAQRAGFPIIYAPEAVVVHPCRRTLAEVAEKARRVGVGFGQAAHLHPIGLREAKERALDRLRLAGRAPRESRSPLLAAGHLFLALATAAGAVEGYLKARR